MRILLGILSLFWKIYVAIIFVITAIFFFPFIYPLLFSLKNKMRSFRIFVVWSWTFRILCFYHVKKNNIPQLPKGPYLIIANHISYLDIFLLFSILPQHPFLFLGKSEILRYPIIGTYFKRLNIPVYRNNRVKAAKSLVRSVQEVKKGWSLVIFPEGKIPDENPKMARFKLGAFELAKRLDLPIVPITYTNNHILFSDPTFILGYARPGVSNVVFHEPILPESTQDMSPKELAKHCYDIINQPLAERYPICKK